MRNLLTDTDKFENALSCAEEQGSWAEYAVRELGMTDTGDDDLDELLADLYKVYEAVHLRANQLSLKHDIRFFGDK